ncbi:MAG: hypothetical protein K2H01_11580, partial [Ruminococcus sp.]|nr:hypothetical protein [Ruminococcus sp.]
RVGIHDSFFELGGDSIKAIRIISKLRSLGYNATVRQMLNLKKVEKIAESLTTVKEEIIYEQGEVSGAVIKTPIMRMFESKNMAKIEHFNQSMLLPVGDLDSEVIKKVFISIVKHHDALRMVHRDNELMILPVNESGMFDYFYYDLHESLNYKEDINTIGNTVQSSINLSDGPIVKLAEFDTVDGKYLLICIHHFAIDGVSWRIILEDLGNAINQVMNGNEIAFPLKTASFIDWAYKLESYRQTEKFAADSEYWNSRIDFIRNNDISIEYDSNAKFEGYRDIKFVLSAEESNMILEGANNDLDANINDLLLSALANAIHKVTGQNDISIMLESHGRDVLNDDIAVDRTVGWFTSEYPIIIHSYDDMSKTVLSNREERISIQDGGIGYGLLFGSEKDRICSIEFNYLGQFGDGLADNSDENNSLDDISYGLEIAPENEYSNGIMINGSAGDNSISFTISYAINRFNDECMTLLTNKFKESIVEVGKFISEKQNNVKKNITAELIDMDVNAANIEEISEAYNELSDIIESYRDNIRASKPEAEYRSTSVQKLLFSRLDAGTVTVVRVPNSVKKENLMSAVKALVKEQSALRSIYNIGTKFVTEYSYHDEWYIPFFDEKEHENIVRSVNLLEGCKELYISENLFSFITVIKRRKDYLVVINVHHGLFDQYSGFIVRDRLNALLSGSEPGLYRYSDYVASVRSKNNNTAYTEKILSNYDESLKKMTYEKTSGEYNEYSVMIDLVLDKDRLQCFNMKPIENILRVFCEYNPMYKKIGDIPFTITYHGRNDNNNDMLGILLVNLPGLYNIETDTISGGMEMLDKNRNAPSALFEDRMYTLSYKENSVYAINYHGVYIDEQKKLHPVTNTYQVVADMKIIELSCDLYDNGLRFNMPITAKTFEDAKKQAEKSLEIIKDIVGK